MTVAPRAGVHYPESTGEFLAWFSSDVDCLDYLEWLRWRDGFVCPDCGHARGWRLGDGRFECASCRVRTSPTAGTIFERTRTPLTVWFHACWMFATEKHGVSALSVKRALGIGSYQTAWAMLHRLRSVLVRPGRELLSGEVEVDETFIGGQSEGDRGGRTPGEKSLVVIAVERRQPKGFGRCRMAVVANASTKSLRRFLTDNVAEGSIVVTDGWQPYRAATKGRYIHQRHVAPGRRAPRLLPAVHRVASLVKRWLAGTHQDSASESHLPSYLNEFVFRFNRRRSRHRGLLFYRLLELAVAHDPVSYKDLVRNPKPKARRPVSPGVGGHPASLDRPPARRPWRTGAPYQEPAKAARTAMPQHVGATATSADHLSRSSHSA